MLSNLYKNRFKEKELEEKYKIWKVLYHNFLYKFISETDIVLDLAAGYCEFINNISCAKKIALDLNTDIQKFADKNVQIIISDASNIKLENNSVDVCFISNFFEHMPTKNAILNVLNECYRVLKINGKIIILQPNIKYVKGAYWDFFDHVLPLTDKSLKEALLLSNFSISKVIPKFLPYTTKSKIPKKLFFIKTYLNIPFLWNFFGKQSLLIGIKK